jgi:tripartite ATP-independent transporter DctM subunit
MTALLLFVGFIVLLALRVPITMAIGISVLGALVSSGYGDTLWIIPMRVQEGVNNTSLLAIPFFILAGNLMNAVGLTERIFNLANALIGHFKAGLAQVNVLASFMLAGGTGAAVADIAGLGVVEIRAMRERGYTAPFAAAVTTVSAILAPFIPPSVPLVVYSYLANVSVARMFLAGIVPAVLIAISLLIYNRVYAIVIELPTQPRATLGEVWTCILKGTAPLAAPGIIMAGILTGTTTAAEAGILACGYTIVLSLIYRTFRFSHLWNAFADTMLMTSMILIIIGFANGMGWLLAVERIPQDIAAAVPGLIDQPILFLLSVAVMVLVIGCFIDGVTAKLLLVPILLPLVDAYGVDRVHFGIVMQMGLILGLATPPLGIGLYIVARIADVPVESVVRSVLPFFIPLLIVLGLLMTVPQISLWLPNTVLGAR